MFPVFEKMLKEAGVARICAKVTIPCGEMAGEKVSMKMETSKLSTLADVIGNATDVVATSKRTDVKGLNANHELTRDQAGKLAELVYGAETVRGPINRTSVDIPSVQQSDESESGDSEE